MEVILDGMIVKFKTSEQRLQGKFLGLMSNERELKQM